MVFKLKGGHVTINSKKQALEKNIVERCISDTEISMMCYIFEHDNDMIVDLETNPKFKKTLDDLSKELGIDIKVRISESNLCTPDHWKEDKAENERPLIVILISCRSYTNVMMNNFGRDPPKTEKGKIVFVDTKPPRQYDGGIFKNVYYFGFTDYIHPHDGEIYSCKHEHPEDKIPYTTCHMFTGEKKQECCKVKKQHFASMFSSLLEKRNCMKFTKESLGKKFKELQEKIKRVNESKQKMEAITREFTTGKFFLLDGDKPSGISCDHNECKILQYHKNANNKSREFNLQAKAKEGIKAEVGPEVLRRQHNKETQEVLSQLEKGLDINKAIEGITLLEKAMANKNTIMVKMLLARGAKIPKKLIKPILEGGLFTESPVKEVVHEFFIRNPDMINAPLQGGVTPLCTGIINSDKDFVKFCLDNGADPNQMLKGYDYTGMYPIHLAVSYGFVDGLELLVSKGANINSETGNHIRPAKLACMRADIAVLRFLVSKGATLTDDEREACDIYKQLGGRTMRKRRQNKRTRKQ
jgi:ankyrin repeat protein